MHKKILPSNCTKAQLSAVIDSILNFSVLKRHGYTFYRCGVKDIVGKGATTRKKRYALQGKYTLTQTCWKISYIARGKNSPMRRAQVHRQLERYLCKGQWVQKGSNSFISRGAGRLLAVLQPRGLVSFVICTSNYMWSSKEIREIL
jgi:hypothetical protein